MLILPPIDLPLLQPSRQLVPFSPQSIHILTRVGLSLTDSALIFIELPREAFDLGGELGSLLNFQPQDIIEPFDLLHSSHQFAFELPVPMLQIVDALLVHGVPLGDLNLESSAGVGLEFLIPALP